MLTPLLVIITINLILGTLFIPQGEVCPPICHYDGTVTDEWIIETYKRNFYIYENGSWSYGRVKSIWQYATMKNGSISFNTNNYMYPLLTNVCLPIDGSFLGIFKLPDHDWTSHDAQSFLQYFKEGTLNAYRCENDRTIWLRPLSDNFGSIDQAFLEWYNTWENLDAFKHYKQLYVHPSKFSDTSWASIRTINKYSQMYINLDLFRSIITNADLSSSRDFISFSTIDFVASGTKVPLYELAHELWSDYTPEQAMYRYRDYEKQKIGFWTPNDLMIATEIGNIASLLDQNPIEITTILSNTLAHTNETLIFNHINNKISFVEMGLERSIEYVY